nr:maleylpyruvate isomerase family mycothiol-dependent enzyme [Geodermatophilus pulveris]
MPAGRWTSPSPCAGWSAADVVGHPIGTQREFLGSHGGDLGGAPDVAADPAAAWRAHAARVATALSDDTVPARPFDGFSGPTTVGAALVQSHVREVLVHRWDVARAVRADDRLTDEELDRVAAGGDGSRPALHMGGICRPAVDPPADAHRQTRVLARLGRSA